MHLDLPNLDFLSTINNQTTQLLLNWVKYMDIDK